MSLGIWTIIFSKFRLDRSISSCLHRGIYFAILETCKMVIIICVLRTMFVYFGMFFAFVFADPLRLRHIFVLCENSFLSMSVFIIFG